MVRSRTVGQAPPRLEPWSYEVAASVGEEGQYGGGTSWAPQEQRPTGRGQGAGGCEGASHFFHYCRKETYPPLHVEEAQPWGGYLCLVPLLTRSSMSRMGLASSCSRLFSGDTGRSKHRLSGPLSPGTTGGTQDGTAPGNRQPLGRAPSLKQVPREPCSVPWAAAGLRLNTKRRPRGGVGWGPALSLSPPDALQAGRLP